MQKIELTEIKWNKKKELGKGKNDSMKTYLSKLPTKKTYTVADGGVIEIGDKDYTIVLDDNGKVDVDGVKQQLEVDYAVEPLSFKFKLLQIKKSKIK